MPWYSRKAPKAEATGSAPSLTQDEGLWLKCPRCDGVSYRKEIERNLKVCPKCQYHFRIPIRERCRLLCDDGRFDELDNLNIKTLDPLSFKDTQKYPDRVKAAQKKTGLNEAVVAGEASIIDQRAIIVLFEFEFLGGSMGSVVGEIITRAIEAAGERNLPLIIFTASGGARMQEGILSLLQMAKVSNALAYHRKRKLPFIAYLTDPTTGGVAASIGMGGDFIFAEPQALIGFAGPRVIRDTVREELPEGFQRAEFLVEHGLIDRVVPRKEMRETLSKLLSLF